MFQDNPLLAQLKQQIHDSKERVEGTVKSTDKAYGFLECEKKKLFYCTAGNEKSDARRQNQRHYRKTRR